MSTVSWSAPRFVIHPQLAVPHASFFFEGLYRHFGRCWHYSCRGFPETDPRSGLLLLRTDVADRRLCIAPYDRPEIDAEALGWCDVYGKVNLDAAFVPAEHADKFVALGPTFGVRTWGAARSAMEFARTAVADHRMAFATSRDFYAQWHRRVPEEAYRPGGSEDDYIFFVAWPWKTHADVNPPREAFIRACKLRQDVRFEGGFAPRRRSDMPELEGLLATRRYPIREYLERLRRSAVAFNTPAVHQCLGWKLGEFLALGKAIITLPLTRQLPAPLEHEVHVHVVDGSPASIADGLDRLIGDRSYRRKLEHNARSWYEQWLRPERVMTRLLEKVGLEGAPPPSP